MPSRCSNLNGTPFQPANFNALSNATVLGLGVAYAPQAASAIDQLAPWFNRLMALGIIGMLATYVVWVWRTP